MVRSKLLRDFSPIQVLVLYAPMPGLGSSTGTCILYEYGIDLKLISPLLNGMIKKF